MALLNEPGVSLLTEGAVETMHRHNRRFRCVAVAMVVAAVLLYGVMIGGAIWVKDQDRRLREERRQALLFDCRLHEGNTRDDCDRWINQ